VKKLSVETEWLIRKATAPLREGKVSPARYDKFRDKMVAFINRPGNYDRAKHWNRRVDLLEAVQKEELNPYVNKFRDKFKKASAKNLSPVMPSFLDELNKIAAPQLLLPPHRNPAQRFGTWASGHVRGAVGNAGQAVSNFGTPVKSFKQGWGHTFKPQGKPLGMGWKAFMGLQAAQGAYSVAKKEDPFGQGHSRLRRGLRFAGEQAGGFIGAFGGNRSLGLTGGIVGSMIGSRIGDTTGKIADRLRGHKTPPTLPPPPQGQQG